MTVNQEPLYWKTNKTWYRINKERDCFELTDQAPPRAVESFKLYCAMQIATGSKKYKE